jgi:hypothetical protein
MEILNFQAILQQRRQVLPSVGESPTSCLEIWSISAFQIYSPNAPHFTSHGQS